MKNLSLVILCVFCLLQLNINLFTDKNISNAVSADTDINPEKNIPVIDGNIPDNIETATFAMGWFWGPDSLFGILPGVIRTRVGYAGGEKINPTYYNLEKHSETIQIDYNPAEISYVELLQLFWNNHNCRLKSATRQYMSIIFYHNQKQQALASQSLQEQEKKLNAKVVTEIISLKNFYLAENYHQKYKLQQSSALRDRFMEIYPNFIDFINSTAVARVNGFLGGHGTCEQLKKEIDTYGLPDPLKKFLLDRVCEI